MADAHQQADSWSEARGQRLEIKLGGVAPPTSLISATIYPASAFIRPPNSETVRSYSGPELRNRQIVLRTETLFQLQSSLLLHDKPCGDADHKGNQENGNNDGVGGDHGHEKYFLLLAYAACATVVSRRR
jgi:hypothetical protein